jgi:23S rRNA pseudouridine955/2504/2580 synthase
VATLDRLGLQPAGSRLPACSEGLKLKEINHLRRTTDSAHYRALTEIFGACKSPSFYPLLCVLTDGLPLNSESVSQAAPSVRYITVDEESAGQRLDNFLIRILKGVPKTHVYRIIRSGEVRRNKGRVNAEDRVMAGDVIRLPPIRLSERAQAKHQESAAPARDFPVLYEDDAFLAIAKPAGVAVHGGSGVSFGVIEQMRQSRPQAKLLELVHRLDRETSGLLLVAKKKQALRVLQDQFRERETGKTYLAMVKGAWPARLKVLDQSLHKYLLPDGERRVKVVAADHPDAMRSVTLVKVIQRLVPPKEVRDLTDALTLLEVTIKTGRTHQIRVHLANAGHVILGDDKYGDFELNRQLARSGLKRMFLHAWRLRLHHPVSGDPMELQAQLPQELQEWVRAMEHLSN